MLNFRCVKFGFIVLTLSHIGQWKFNIMAKNSLRIWKKELLRYIKMAYAIRRLPTAWNWAAARWPWAYSGLTGQVPLRTDLTVVDQRRRVHMLSAIFIACLWKTGVWVLPALLQKLKGWGISQWVTVLRPYAAHCFRLVCMAVIPEEMPLLKMMPCASSLEEAFLPQAVCWRQAD